MHETEDMTDALQMKNIHVAGRVLTPDSVSKETPIAFRLVWTDDMSPKDIKEPSTQLFEAGVSESGSRRELNLC